MPNNILVSRKKIEYIAHNHIITEHAQKQISERCFNANVKQMILNSVLWWVNTDGTINIATDLYHYFVVSCEKVDMIDKFIILTYKDKSLNNYSVIDKFIFAYKGIERKTQGDNEKYATD